jgi:hypothetical protein
MNTTTSRMVAAATGALVLVLGSTAMSSLAHPGSRPRAIDLTASAHPTAAAPEVSDTAFDVSSSWRHSVRADTTAVSSAGCRNCRGDASTLQVVYAHRPHELEADNAAVAWAHCRKCGSTAVSVQVVVVHGGPLLTAHNRAFAANAACRRCHTAALAYQIVVEAPDAERLSRAAVQELWAWVEEQSRLLREGAGGAARRAPSANAGADATATLEGLVNDDLGSRTDRVDVDRM